MGAQEGPKLGLGGVTSGRVREARAEIVPDPLGSAGTGLFASTVMGKLPVERLFNTERNNLISNYWCRTLGEPLHKARTGCFAGAACQFCHLIMRLFSAKALDRERKKTLNVIVLVIFCSH